MTDIYVDIEYMEFKDSNDKTYHIYCDSNIRQWQERNMDNKGHSKPITIKFDNGRATIVRKKKVK